ncbi:MAG TPA: hypothetical protein DCZ95_18120 [Verrucomicrobia bacterium]|nr:hypothetical protein [Verrucomicrobiota bacterium]
MYAENIKERAIERELQKERRTVPYPKCTEICSVTEVWGEDECRLICPQKFCNGVARLVVALMVAGLLFGCAGWTYNGITREDLQGGDFISVSAGFGASYLVHTASHIVAAEIAGEPWHYDGLSEIVDGDLSPSEARWFARAGFLGQLAVGWTMKACGADGPFARGYYTGAMFEVATYPALVGLSGDGNDIEMIEDNGGHGYAEWAAYSAAAVGLVFSR